MVNMNYWICSKCYMSLERKSTIECTTCGKRSKKVWDAADICLGCLAHVIKGFDTKPSNMDCIMCGSNENYTPYYAVDPILKYIDKTKTIWCPFDCGIPPHTRDFSREIGD